MDKKQIDELILEMRAIKKLLILQLLNTEVPQRQIASMLEVSEATMSRMIPRGASARGARASKMKSKSEASINDE